MELCLDVGNTQLFGGVFDGDDIVLRFRHSSRDLVSSDQLGVFLKSVLRENNIVSDRIARIAICSVVPNIDYSLASACRKYFSIEPFFLQAGVKTGLRIEYRNPLDVGADRIANAIAATQLYPKQNLILVDFGTATTFCAITHDKRYLGGVIMPGLRLAMEALSAKTAKLSTVKIVKPETIIGRSTTESVQSGLYYSQMAAIQYLLTQISQQHFDQQTVTTVGTGGFAQLFEEEKIFDKVAPNLVLHGLRHCLAMN